MIDYRKDNNWTVYIHIVPKRINNCNWDKYYVGITGRLVNARWGNNGCGYKRQKFYKAIEQYGWENIEHYIVANNLTEQEAKEMEKTLIKLLNSNDFNYGYNNGNGGTANSGWHHDEETRKFFKIRSGGGNNPNAKKIYQFNPETKEFINSYACASEAAVAVGVKMSSKDNISAAARLGKKCHEFLWEYENNIYVDTNGNIQIKKQRYFPKYRSGSYGVKIYQFDLITKKYINKYNKIKDASIATGINRSTIHESLIGKGNGGGYIWRYEKDVIEKDNSFFIA